MKIIFSSIFFILFSLSSIAQNGFIEGEVVYSKNSKGITGAQIELVETDYETMTIFGGRFLFRKIPEGVYDIKISHEILGDTIISAIEVFSDSVTEMKVIMSPPHCPYLETDICPVCRKNDRAIPILYGFPSKRAIEMAEKEELILAGCDISWCDPKWYCKRDKVKY